MPRASPCTNWILAEAGATPEIVGRLLAEAHRERPNDRMIHAYAFMLEGALGTLRVERLLPPLQLAKPVETEVFDPRGAGGSNPSSSTGESISPVNSGVADASR
jgi:hypothetical protein